MPAGLGATLGDSWAQEPAPTAAQSSPLSLDYYRAKVLEYQGVLNALDTAYAALNVAIDAPGLDVYAVADLAALRDEYETKRFTLKATAEAINMGAAAVNALGGRMPELSLPRTLGFAPAIPIAAIAAIGTAGVLISWGRAWLAGVNDRLKTAQLLAAQDSPEAAAALAASIAQSDAALKIASESGLAALAPYLKWAALAALAFIAWRGIQGYRARNPAVSYDDTDDE